MSPAYRPFDETTVMTPAPTAGARTSDVAVQTVSIVDVEEHWTVADGIAQTTSITMFGRLLPGPQDTPPTVTAMTTRLRVAGGLSDY